MGVDLIRVSLHNFENARNGENVKKNEEINFPFLDF